MTERIGLIRNVAVATCGTSVSGVTCVYAIGRSYYCVVGVTKSRYLISSIRIVTCGTSISGVACSGTGRRSYYSLVAVTERCHGFLRNESFVTYRTMLTGGKTGCSTGRCYCLVDYLGVTECCYGFLRNESFVTYGTVLTGGKTGCGTGRSYCGIVYLGMSGSRNRIRSNDGLITNGTLDSIGPTVLSTSGINRGNSLGSMTGSIDAYGLSGKLFAAIRAINYEIVATLLSTSGSNVVFLNCLRSRSVSLCRTYNAQDISVEYEILISPTATAFLTNVILNVTVLGTGCGNCLNVSDFMSCILVCELVTVITVSVTNVGVFVRKLRSLIGLGVGYVTTITLSGVCAVSLTSSITVGYVVSEAVTKSGSKLGVTYRTKLCLCTGRICAGSMTESLTYSLLTIRASLRIDAICCYPRMSDSLITDNATNKTYRVGLTGLYLPGVLTENCSCNDADVGRYLLKLDGIDLTTVYCLNVNYGACAKIKSIFYSNRKIEDGVIAILNGKSIAE